MAQKHNPEKEEELRKKIESVTGITPKTPHDFDILAESIFARTRQHVSATTLKRFWKYIEKENNTKTRISVLDVLAVFVGYTSMEAFINADNSAAGSDFVMTKEISVADLEYGDMLRIVWDPARSLTVRYEGADLFTVIDSVNSKLDKEDTFHCSSIVETMPLLLTQVSHANMQPCSYICGRIGGVKFTKL